MHGLLGYMKEEISSLFEEDTYNSSLCKALNVLAKQLVNVRKQKTRTYSAQSKVIYFSWRFSTLQADGLVQDEIWTIKLF